MRTWQCPRCVYYRSESTCEAYPRGIPEEILTGQADHREPYRGDGGLRYRARTTVRKSEQMADAVERVVDREELAYRRVRRALGRQGYGDADFEVGGRLYGESTNRLLERVREGR